MSNRLIEKVSKIARNTLQEDLIRTLDLICEYAKNDIQKYKELLFIAFFNEQQVANYERFMELDYKNGWSLQDRKDRIIYTLLSKNIFTPHVLKEQAKIFTNGEIEVIENYRHGIKLKRKFEIDDKGDILSIKMYYLDDELIREYSFTDYVYDKKHNWISRKIVERNKNNEYIGTKIEKRIISYYE